MPNIVAVKGSNAPIIAVFVEPINFIEIFIVSREIIVGKTAKPNAKKNAFGEFKTCKFVNNFVLKM